MIEIYIIVPQWSLDFAFRLTEFVLEMFSDVGAVKTTTRRRQHRGSIKHKSPILKSADIPKPGYVRSIEAEIATDPLKKDTSVFSRIVSYQLVLSLSSTRIASLSEDRKNTATTMQTILFHGRPDVIQSSSTGAGVRF